MRRYLGRIAIGLTLLTPLLIVMTYQLAPRRDQRPPEHVASVAVASAETLGGAGQNVVGRSLGRGDAADTGVPRSLASMILSDRERQYRPTAWYRVAGEEQGVSPYLLEALHQIESSAAPDGCWPNVEGSGAVGPFQFKRSTFESHAVDGNGDGVTDICGFADSLFSAAAYLKWLGADGDLDSPGARAALTQYGTDADRVIDLARYYRARELALTAEALVTH
jgi:hypothetical protein